jgi:uncharacterized membrane protein
MKELLIVFAVIVIGFALMADTSITFKPFSIKFESPYNAIGYMLVFIGIIFIKIDSEKKGAKKAVDTIVEQLYESNETESNK